MPFSRRDNELATTLEAGLNDPPPQRRMKRHRLEGCMNSPRQFRARTPSTKGFGRGVFS